MALLTKLGPNVAAAPEPERATPSARPRYIAYVGEFPRTPSNKIAKNKLIAGVDDLRSGAFDLLEGKMG